MKIHDDHLYHGAALLQIAEHPTFKSINAFVYRSAKSRSAFLVNDDIGVYLKYAEKPHGSLDEYTFNFRREHLEELEALHEKRDRTFVALVCVRVREICCLRYSALMKLVKLRDAKVGHEKDQYSIYVQAPERQQFLVYVSPPRTKGRMMGDRKIPRNAFPARLFAKRTLSAVA